MILNYYNMKLKGADMLLPTDNIMVMTCTRNYVNVVLQRTGVKT